MLRSLRSCLALAAALLLLVAPACDAFRVPAPAARRGPPRGRMCAPEEPATVQSLWFKYDKPLLRVGGKGIASSHRNSLSELIAAHGVVRVKFNKTEDVLAAATDLGGEAAEVLDVRGPHALFAARGFKETLAASDA